MTRPAIEHVVVLLLENRSFDHMFGFLDHPSPKFQRLTGEKIGQVKVSSDARYEIDAGPDHSHDGVMSQLFGGESFPANWHWDYSLQYPTDPKLNNLGFIESFRHQCADDRARGERIMRCFHPETIPVMATLAKQFALFTHWYSSIPGETWPNRDFAVAARSFGHVNQYYWPRPRGSSIFEKLADAPGQVKGRAPFRIYHDSVAHTFLYPGLYGRSAFAGMDQFFADVKADKLPRYSYIEPDFGLGSTKWFGKLISPAVGDSYGNSQHPTQANSAAEFVAGEHLVAHIYNALVDSMAAHPNDPQNSVFAKTLFLITYDEHGGFFDRETPPRAAQPMPDDVTDRGFKFDLLGLRVPAILISPWIAPGTLIDTPFDHASIPATVRNLFAPTIAPLTARDTEAARFHMIAIDANPTLRTATSANPLPRAAPLDMNAAIAAMQKHGAPATAADMHHPPDDKLRDEWMAVAKTANKLLPPPPLGATGLDPSTDAFAVDVVKRMQGTPTISANAVAEPPSTPKAPAPITPPPPTTGETFVATALPPPTSRTLRAYAFDPSRGHMLDNSMELKIPYQELAPGPVEIEKDLKSRLAVVDYDGSAKQYYTPVNLDDRSILLSNGLAPSESDVRFHQQMVYAVARDTVTHFEVALGRKIHWRRAGRAPGDPRGWAPGDIVTLGLHPHAMRAANAYYSADAHGVLFGYFAADRTTTTQSLPGQAVFTCLSHDIIVHEMTHAILDGQRAHFLERTNRDVAAFHEGFADLAALFRHFTHREVLLDTLQRTGGKLYSFQLRPEALGTGNNPMIAAEMVAANPLIGLAHQFGDATGLRGALRSALGTPPTPDDYQNVVEPHRRGSILVAAVFDAFFSVYVRRTSDLWRIYRAGGGRDNPIDLPAPLANQLCNVAIATANQFFEMCVRSIDYCPPVDLTFGEFLRAMITSEVDRDPDDTGGIRTALLQAFRLRGIYPDGARFYSEDALCWARGDDLRLPAVAGLMFDASSRAGNDAVADQLERYFARQDVRAAIGFDPVLAIDLKSFHQVVRIVRGSLQRDLVVEIVQTKAVSFDDDPFSRYPFRAGATLIISDAGEVRWCVTKPMCRDGAGGGSEADVRNRRQQAFLDNQGLSGDIQAASLQLDFAGIHGGV